jgi:hypothetical protein
MIDSLVDGVISTTEVLQGDSSSSMYADSTPSLDECTSILVESLASSSVDDGLGELKDHFEEVNNVAEGDFRPTEVTTVDKDFGSSMPTEISGELPSEPTLSGNSEREETLMAKMVPMEVPSMENHCITSSNDPDLETGDKEFCYLEPSIDFSVEQKDRGALEGVDDYNNTITEDVPSTSEFSENETVSIIRSADISDIHLDTFSNLSLEKRVANFIQNGDLDPVDGKSNM